MFTRRPTRRIAVLATALALALAAVLGASGTALAHHNQMFGMTGCVNASGRLVLTATWSLFRVTDWSWFVESSDGNGGLSGPVPTPGSSGTVTRTFPAGFDPANVSALTVSFSNGAGTVLAKGRLTQRPAGWPACIAHPNTFGMSACISAAGGEMILTGKWNRMRVTDWSYFIEHPDGSGGTFQPVPTPGSSGTITQSFEGDNARTDAISISFFNGSGQELAIGRLARRPAGWPPC
jgi:hypothetical protein